MEILKIKTSPDINGKIKQIQPFIFRHAVPFLLYVIITLLMICTPIEFDLAGRYIGHGEVVFWSNYFWWFDYSATSLLTNPLHNTHLFFPLGLDMYDGIFPFMLFIPITHLLGSVASYNIYVLSSFFLAAYGMYLLMDYLLKDPYVAFVSGLIFAFCPFHFGAAFGHLHTFSIMWIPFFVFFFLKMNKEPTHPYILLSGVFFAINALTSWTVAAMLSIFVIIYYILNYRPLLTKRGFVNVATFGIVSLIIMSPGLYLMLVNYMYNEHMVKSLYSFIYYSADLLGFVTPSPIHPFFGEVSRSIYSQFTGNYSENIVFMGYSAIVLALISLISCRKTKIVRLFTISLFVFLILSLGPVLHIDGLWKYTEQNLTFMLPGVITAYLPFLNMIRVPSRYDIMVMFCLAILAAYGIKSLLTRYNIKGSGKALICVTLSLIVLFEFAGVIPTQAVKPTPEFYYNISQDGDYSIVDVPICRIGTPYGGETMMRYYEYQKVHNKKMFGGYWSRIDPAYTQIIQPDPVVGYLYSGTEDIYTNSEIDPKIYLKNNYNVEYIVLHTALLQDETLNRYIQYLGDSYYIDNSVSSDPLIIYSTNTSNKLNISEGSTRRFNPVVWLGDGW
ncbi:MAG TPA: hypothetical protein DHW42_00495, partial [Candidatus Marinimicrobia bacterium]|nr:hypothetical protein [Candidatus Neomarinimicrobiota bacterium]